MTAKKFNLSQVFYFLITLLIFSASTIKPSDDPNDCEGCKDPKMFNRMPGFHIYNAEELEFDRYEFITGPNKTEVIEGRHTTTIYYANEGIKLPSGLQITNNYIKAAQKAGGKKLYEYEDGGWQYAIVQITINGVEVWARIEAGSNGMYNVNVVEKKAMEQNIVINADNLIGSINETGKATLYGIFFDTGKSEIKPESEATINEIATLLKKNNKLKLFVVGHTDNVGNYESNLKLSKQRADSVVDYLVKKHSVNQSRLIAFGAGPTSPISTNGTEEGKAKNRRVELVEQ